MKQVPAERIVRPGGFYLSIFWDILSVGLAVLTSWAYHRYLVMESSLWMPAVAAFVFALFSIFPMLMTKSRNRRIGVSIAQVAGLMSFFWYEPVLLLVSVGTASVFFVLWGDYASRDLLRNGLNFKFSRVTSPYVNKLITAITFLAVMLFLPQWQAEQGFLSRPNFQYVFEYSANFVNQFYPELKLKSTFGEFAKSFVRLQYKGNPVFEQMPTSAKEKAVADASVQFQEGMQRSWNMELSEGASLGDIFYQYLIQLFEKWRGNFGERFLAAWAIAMFFIVRAGGFIASLVIGSLGYFFFQLLLAMDVIHLYGESAMQEQLEYS